MEFTLQNTGTEALSAIEFEIALPTGLNYVSGSTKWHLHGYPWNGPSSTYDPDPGFSPIKWTQNEISELYKLEPNDYIEISFEVEPDCMFSGGDLELHTTAEDDNGLVYTDTFDESFSTNYSAPDLDISITSNKSSTNPIGVMDLVSWEIQVTNDSGYDLDVVWIEADLGTAFTYNSSNGDGTYGFDNGTNTGQAVTWELVNLSAGATANLTLRAESDSSPCSTDLDVDVYTSWGAGLVDGNSDTKPGVDAPDNNACLSATAISDTHSGTREPDMDFVAATLNPSPVSGFGGFSTLLVGVENNGTTDAYDSDLVITLPSGLTLNVGSSERGIGMDSSVVLSGTGDPMISSNTLTYYDTNDQSSDLFNQLQASGGNDTGLLSLGLNVCGASSSSEIGIEYRYFSACHGTQHTISTSSILQVQTPDIAVEHTFPTYMAQDSTTSGQIVVTNNGSASPGSLSHLIIEETLPSTLSYVPGSTIKRVDGGAWQNTGVYDPVIIGNVLRWTETDLSFSPNTLVPNSNLEISFEVTSDSAFSGGNLENTTTLEIDCGSGSGNDASIDAQDSTTLTLLPSGPIVATNQANSITSTGAILNGEVNAIGYDTNITFEYGLTNAYGASVTADQSPLNTDSSIPVTFTLTNLLPNTEYHFRLVAENSIGTTNGADQTFTTLGTTVTTEIHSGSVHSAVPSASLNDSLHAMATVIGNGSQATGSVSFTVYNNPSCYGTGTAAGNVPLDASGVADPSTSAVLTKNGLSFKAHYQGDSTYAATDGVCTSISTSAYPDILSLSMKAIPQNNAVVTSALTSLKVQFNQDVLHGTPTDSDSADNPLNYLLVEAGLNGVFDTSACGGTGGGLQVDDTQISINSVSYDAAQFTAELSINDGKTLPNGQYQLFICGTTSIANPARTVYLNNHLSDSLLRFEVQMENAQISVLPATGFAPDSITMLSDQPLDKMYNQTGMEIQIPALHIRKAIVGVSGPEWDISWLGDHIGYLQGTAFPTWNGNSVLTGHVANANGNPGPFAELAVLKWGDRFSIHAWGQEYIYEVCSVDLRMPPDATAVVNKHEEFPWLTLITCHGYDEETDSYQWRTIVRAVLVEIKEAAQ